MVFQDPDIRSVLSGSKRWHVSRADRLDFLRSLPADSADLVFGSPPYSDARTYGIDFDLKGQEWVDWMVRTFKAARKVCTGLVGFVVEGKTRKFTYDCTPFLLTADLHRAGFTLRKPPIYYRRGIPGSGNKDWLKNNYELIVCTTRGGELPWSNNTAMGSKPKCDPGGEVSYRTLDGTRVNAKKTKTCTVTQGGTSRNGGAGDIRTVRRNVVLPEIANPGNVIHCNVGGGNLGSGMAHENEAPFPEKLAEFFIRSFCRPNGIVLDCFSGSGTTGAVAVKLGRRFIGCDIRDSQVELSNRRIAKACKGMGLTGL